MICVHVTEDRNLDSIAEHGLLPSKPYLPSHGKLFKRYLRTEKVIYSTVMETKKRIKKFIKDFVYFQTWGKPRNVWIGKHQREADKVYSTEFKLKAKDYTILTFQFNPEKEDCLRGPHIQDKTLWGLYDIDDDFSHDDKPLVVLPKRIEPNRLNEIGKAFPVIRNNRIEDVRIEAWV